MTALFQPISTDLELFDAMCDVLRAERCPMAKELSQLIGSEKPNTKNEIRGSIFLIPFDKRFKIVAINPDLSDSEDDLPIEYISFIGDEFIIKMSDLLTRFKEYRTQQNTYDGGTQIFFYPIPKHFGFSAIDLWTQTDEVEIEHIHKLTFNRVTFMFGDNLRLGRDGYSMKR